MNIINLTEESIYKWNRDGFIKLAGFFDNKCVNQISDYVDEIASWDDVNDKWMKWYEVGKNNSKVLSRVENFLDYHLNIKKILLEESKIERILYNLLGEEVALYKEKVNIKAPNGSGFVPHQDIYDTGFRETDIVVMIAVDLASEANGCLKVCGNGEYKKGIIGTGKNGRIDPEIYKKYEWEVMECNSGDILIFDSYVPHYSEPNSSDFFRRAIFLSFKKISSSGYNREEYYKNKRINYPPEKPNADITNLKPSSTTIYGIEDKKI